MTSLSDFVVVSPILDALLSILGWLFDTASNRSLVIPKKTKMRLTELQLVIEEILTFVLIAEREINRRINSSLWLEEVKRTAYDANDLLDLFSTNKVSTSSYSLMLHFAQNLHNMSKIRHMSLKFKKLLKKQKDKVGNYDSKHTDMIMIIRDHFQCRSSPNLQAVDELMLLLQSNKVFGREDDKKRMLVLLTEDNKQIQLSVIPILGVDGIGKTTLARLLYNDEKVLKHFDLKAWVSCDAQNFDKVKIAKGIIESVTGFPLQPEKRGDLNDLVRNALESKRSLIVLDDIQIIYREDIDILNFFFGLAALGSKVMLTTPSLEVASVIGTDECYELSELSYNDSWSMFSYLAFDSSDAIHNSQLRVAATIVDRCRGIPLLLNLLGSLMRFKKEKKDWIAFKTFLKESSIMISSFGRLMRQKASVSHDISNHLVLHIVQFSPGTAL
ncbi:putative disease resistance protein RGA3 [Cornus florida]|uniref:putative disease resistance protein RGA3 n=1 Tax=Cornus florida TaxID=4283 RepID=UPI00289F31A3|nr:putative disease resistance protein RGA3 [Cornus florida]